MSVSPFPYSGLSAMRLRRLAAEPVGPHGSSAPAETEALSEDEARELVDQAVGQTMAAILAGQLWHDAAAHTV